MEISKFEGNCKPAEYQINSADLFDCLADYSEYQYLHEQLKKA